ncbi:MULTISPECIES: flagellar biosynthesis protein FlhB [Nitrosomonas]|uniref:Flagellar biosynthetic protein FlhB n=1 Tax=Nitrosomonas europaea (strain ATCC 19718 / CIP 103999 / KCTC 2705 / NBRC 14298) TaxID=228410 RepID=Q820H2_NITEU|nr:MULTISPECIES: flagellar biosynthesis protein FlhB [Nitrosomonas]CAD86399.1 FlhB HrpN YscU SpaS Family [Nitrosomonas europaea ATCC 19718]SDW78742.1 flagellar biosynthetic protein FlhB [Nitrosomonas europaea]SET31563.1 flagellar biosynthetic protein FlhB [Nitrosomonas europaea]SJZ87983.1 flagellar biosynthetic protein FlhB [Nitrosomonas europaea]HBF25416.1 flagellar type III secretion system protein FlhB [Nitrosomonas sp.]
MADDNDLERTEPASPRRLEKAREEGQVARSQELTTFTLLIAASSSLWVIGSIIIQKLSAVLESGLRMEQEVAFNPALLLPRLFQLALDGLLAIAPLLGWLVIIALVAPMLLSGWLFSSKALFPDLKRLNPVNGLKRIFSSRGLIELVKAIAKVMVIGGVAAGIIWSHKQDVLDLVGMPLDTSLISMSRLIGLTFMLIVGAMLLIVVIDVPFQIWNHARQLRMSREDLRKEAKEDEGDPQVKGRIRNMQRQIARRRMMAEVPKADVVVTNPTHYAVALKYQDRSMRAPKVVAKGTQLIAARIRELADEHHIPVLEVPPLARALYHHVELDTEIPETLYTAVAHVLAYIFQLKRYQTTGGIAPQLSSEIAVPEEMDHA